MKDIFEVLNVEVSTSTKIEMVGIEKVFYHLNKKNNYFFLKPDALDLKIIYRSLKDEEAINKLSECTETLIGNVNKMRTIPFTPENMFTISTFEHKYMLGTMYILDLVKFPQNLEGKEESIAISEFEKFILTNDLIKRKKELLSGIGYRYFIHYDPDKLINSVLLDV